MNRCEIDHRPFGLEQVRQDALGEEIRGTNVDRIKRVKLFRRHLFHRPVHGNAGVIDEHIEPAEKIARLFRQAHHLIHAREIGAEGVGGSTGLFYFIDGGFSALIVVGIVQRHRRTPSRKLEGDFPSDSGAGTGHQDALPPMH